MRLRRHQYEASTADLEEAAEPDPAEEIRPEDRRSSGGGPSNRPDRPDQAVDPDLLMKPSRMRRPEPLYGYVVALELVAVALANLVVTHGAGAPKHPPTGLAVVGLLAGILLAVLIYTTRHRVIVGFAAILAAFVVTLPQVPSSVRVLHLFALIIPVMYAIILTQRQNRAVKAQVKAGVGPGARSSAERRAAADTRRRDRRDRTGRRGAEPAPGPQANRRYTPPKARRPSR